MRKYLIHLTLVFFTVAGWTMAEEVIPLPVKIDSTEFKHILTNSGNFYISGQPTKAGLLELKKAGVTTVVSVRTANEMNDRDIVPFNEKKFVEENGMTYVHIPLGGKAKIYNPEALAKFAEAVNQSEGKVLLHCTVAWRASHVWAAYLHKYKNLPIDKAVENASEINFGSYGTRPFKRLLGIE